MNPDFNPISLTKNQKKELSEMENRFRHLINEDDQIRPRERLTTYGTGVCGGWVADQSKEIAGVKLP